MRLRVKMASVVIGTVGLLVPLAGVTGAQAALAWTTPTCVVKGVPYSFVEAGEGATQHSSVAFIIEVSCQPAYGESSVEINAHQLNNACHNTLTWAQPPGVPTLVPSDSFNVQLDDNGNANAVVWGGPSCAATTDLITADLTVPPYTTARTHVVIKPPADTTPGLKVYPKSLVEDSVTSSVAAIFYAEFPSYDSQQQVTFSDDQLYNQCHGNIYWYGSEEVLLSASTKSASTTLDNNGNAFVIAIGGPSCASGHTLGQVELNAAPYTTYTHGFTVLSPRVRIS